MCGIAGAIARVGSAIAREEIERASTALAHRGPDGASFWAAADGGCALAHRRLAVIDLELGQQPFHSEDGSVSCIFNGEIYNFQALRAALEGRGHRFRTRSDGEVIVHLWEDEGERLVQRLRGMFAIALWDARSQRLFLARDRLGKKPLFWGERDGGLVFASELNALCAGWGRGEIAPQALDAYLALGYIPAPLTIEDRYHKLEPASWLMLERGLRPRIEHYWEPRALPRLSLTREEALDELRLKLRESVSLRLMSEVPIGIFLSGGVDSSAVLATMAEVSSQPVQSFSIGFEDAVADESAWAREAAGAVGAVHHELVVRPAALDLLEVVLAQYGEPFADSSCLPTWVLAKLAREHVTVALTGDGGDELFAGYPRFRQMLRFGRAASLLPGALWQLADALLPHRGSLRLLGRTAELLHRDPPGRDYELAGLCGRRLRRELLGPLVTDPGPGEASIRRAWERAEGGELDRLLVTELGSYLPDDLLVKMDIATMAHGLEARSPLLDHELVEMVLRLPEEWKLERRRSKGLLKDAVAGAFRPGFLERPKRGFAIPLERWLSEDAGPLFAAEIRNGPLARSGRLRMAAVERLLAEQEAGVARHQHRLFALFSLSLFLGRRGG